MCFMWLWLSDIFWDVVDFGLSGRDDLEKNER
jgi:hypothetical protein